MDKEKEMSLYEDDTIEFDIEELLEVQGGIDVGFGKDDCGLGCFIGQGYGP